MRNKLTLIFSLFVHIYSVNVFGQTDTSIHYFKKIGWTVKYPAGFQYFIESGLNDTSAGVIYTLDNYKEVNEHFIVLRKDKNFLAMNFYNYSDREITIKNLDSVNNWSAKYFFQASMSKLTFVDSTKSKDNIGGLSFYKFTANANTNENVPVRYEFYGTLRNGYYIEIFCVLFDTTKRNEINEMLKNSKFDRAAH